MRHLFTRTGFARRPAKEMHRPVRWGVFWAGLSLLNLVNHTEAAIVIVDPGNTGTNTSYIQDFYVLNSLNGTVLNGQSQSFDIFFTNNEFLVAAGFTGFTIDLFINQSGDVGTWPTNSYSVMGYLMDAAGNPTTASVPFPDSGTMPAQVWPDWPFYLSDGTQYLPATKIYESKFSGSRIYGNPNGYYINPITFSGVHFDITSPIDPTNTLMGGRIVIANFNGSIFVSPNPLPRYSQYFVGISQPHLALTGSSGLSGSSNSIVLNLKLSGTPNYPYILLLATNLTSPTSWQRLMTNSADANGNWKISVTNDPASVPVALFQAVAWPGSTLP